MSFVEQSASLGGAILARCVLVALLGTPIVQDSAPVIAATPGGLHISEDWATTSWDNVDPDLASAIVDDLAAIAGTPCTFILEEIEIELGNDVPSDTQRLAPLRDIAPRALELIDASRFIESTNSETVDAVVALLAAAAAGNGATSPPLIQRFRIAYRPGAVMQSRTPYESGHGIPAILRMDAFTALYNGDAQEISILAPQEGVQVRSIESVLSPMPMDPLGLEWLRRYPWRRHESEKDRCFHLVLPEDPKEYYLLRLELGSANIPRQFLVGYIDGDRWFCDIRYTSIVGTSEQLWIGQVFSLLASNEQLIFQLETLKELSFKVTDADLTFEAEADARLVDRRQPVTKVYGPDRSAWPSEISSVVR